MYIIARLCQRYLYNHIAFNYEAVAKIFVCVITEMCSTYIIESKFSICEVLLCVCVCVCVYVCMCMYIYICIGCPLCVQWRPNSFFAVIIVLKCL